MASIQTTHGASGGSGPSGPGDPGTAPEIDHFFATLESPDFSIESPISETEALEAITLFSVVNMFLGSKGTRVVGGQSKIDVLAILTMYYGLQDRSLPANIVVSSKDFWANQEAPLLDLRNRLENLGSEVGTLEKEGKRQFNLGLNNDVPGNVEFPRLFRRYVEIANDPLLALNIETEENNPLADKEQINRAIDLLVELKGLLIQIVRSLSERGTIAMNRLNRNWAGLQGDALVILKGLADARLTEDVEEKNPYSVLADLIGKDRDTQVAPYIVLARDGGRLLQLAMKVYQQEKESLEDYDREHLITLFQSGDSKDFLTTLMRTEAAIIKRYPLKNWA
jgi:hypothetical protein